MCMFVNTLDYKMVHCHFIVSPRNSSTRQQLLANFGMSSETSHQINPNIITSRYYFNWTLLVHAFCSEESCIRDIQTNGVGYEMTAGMGQFHLVR